MLRLFALLLLLVSLIACTSQRAVEQDARVAFSGHADQYVIVTVRNRSASTLPRAGSTPRDYDVSQNYSASPAARKELRAIATQHRLREVDGWPIAALGVHCSVFELPSDIPQADAIRQLTRDRRVESVQPLHTFSTLSTTNDPYRGLQSNLDAMHIAQAHEWSRGEKVRIAVIDTGIDATHPDLLGRVVFRKNFVDGTAQTPGELHGTAVAGVIAALDNNSEGISGVAPGALLLGLKACWPQLTNAGAAVCNTFTLAKALSAALDENSDVVNLSLGGPRDPLLQRLIEVGAKRGLIYVGALPLGPLGFPCSIPSVICVGSAGQPDPNPQLFAPGNEILTLVPQGRYDFLSGSSFATASVSASIALLRARDPKLTSDAARRWLSPVSTHSATLGTATSINVCEALARMLGETGCQPPIGGADDESSAEPNALRR